jgi:hypothetical protein
MIMTINPMQRAQIMAELLANKLPGKYDRALTLIRQSNDRFQYSDFSKEQIQNLGLPEDSNELFQELKKHLSAMSTSALSSADSYEFRQILKALE